jgi:NADP-dependent 3-hydroxy acid dehydrogenase YdfG
MFDVNVMAVLVASQAAVHQMRDTTGTGHIVTISSYAGQGDGFRVYGATKAAVNSICKALRKELEDEAIRVITIMPGAVSTNFGRRFPPGYVDKLLGMFGLTSSFDDEQILPDELLAALHERAAAIFASPDDVARTVLFAVTQPSDVSISEVLVGPRKTFPSHV